MAWGSPSGPYITGKSSASGNALTLESPGGGTRSIAAGNVVIVAIASDNSVSGDSQTSLVTSVTDTPGNTYSKIAEFTNGQTAAAAGATVSLWKSVLTSKYDIDAGHIVTVNFGTNVTAKAGIAKGFTIGAGNSVSVTTFVTNATDAADPAAQTITGIANNEYLWLHAIAHEGPQTETIVISTNYTALDGTGTGTLAYSDSFAGTQGGGAAGNMSVGAEYRINTATGDTVNFGGTSADHAQIYVAIKEEAAADPGSTSGSADLVFGEGSSALTGSGALAGSAALVFGSGASVMAGAGALTGSAALVFGEGSSSMLAALQATGTAAISFVSEHQNLVTYSEEFDNADWVDNDLTQTANATTDPLGGSTADKLLDTGAGPGDTDHAILHAVTLADNTTYTFSVYLKTDDRTWCALVVQKKDGSVGVGYVNTSTGAVGATADLSSFQVESVGSGWYRAIATYNSLSGVTLPLVAVFLAETNGDVVFVGDGTGFFVWGAQLEEGTVAGHYSRTTNAPITVTLGEGTLTGSGALVGTAAQVFAAGNSTLVGAGALVGSADLVFGSGASTMGGAINVAASGAMVFGAGSSTLTGSGALVGSSALVFLNSGTLDGTAGLALTGSADLLFGAGSSTLTGSGALVGSADQLFGAGSSTLTGSGALVGSAALVFGEGSSTLTAAGDGATSGAAALVFGAGSSTLTGSGALVGSAALVFGAGSSVITGSGALVASGALVFGSGSSVMQGAGALAGAAPMVFGAGASVMAGAGAMAGAAAITFTAGASTLTGSGALAGAGAMVFGEGASTMTGNAPGAMVGTASMTFGAGSSIMVGSLAMSAIANMVFGASLINTQVQVSDEVARPRPDDGPSIYKPTGLLERRKPRKDVEDRVEESREIQREVTKEVEREFAQMPSIEIRPIASMSEVEVANEIALRLRVQMQTISDEETIMLIAGIL